MYNMNIKEAKLLIIFGLVEQDSNGLIWLPTHDKEMNWDDSMEYAESIGCRLPTREEFKLAYKDGIKFCFEYYWSSESYSFDSAWFFNGFCCNVNHDYRSDPVSVRCVLVLE